LRFLTKTRYINPSVIIKYETRPGRQIGWLRRCRYVYSFKFRSTFLYYLFSARGSCSEVADSGGCQDDGHAFITSRIDYCNSVMYGASTVHIRPLQNVINAAARLVLCKRKYDRITAAIRDSLHWLPVQQRIDYKLCVFVYKCPHQGAPLYLSELCIPVASSTGRSHLRSAAKECLVIS